MASTLRVIDTGVRPATEQIAFDQALVDLHQEGKIPDTLRFLQFAPAALVGRHQSTQREINLDYCEANGIQVGRRLTGGGAIYLDQGQLGWELIIHKQSLPSAALPQVTQQICEATASSISSFGIDAKYRPFSDIEVDGRKISGTGGYFDGDTLVYQGTLLVDMDPSVMVKVLNIPQEKKPEKSEDTAESRVATLTALMPTPPELDALKQALVDGFAQMLGAEAENAPITEQEEQLARQYHDEEIGTQAFIHAIDEPASDPSVLAATLPCAGGQALNAYVRLEGEGEGRIRQILFSGNFFVAPSRTVMDLEAALRGVTVSKVPDAISQFFESASLELMTVQADDFKSVVASALPTTS